MFNIILGGILSKFYLSFRDYNSFDDPFFRTVNEAVVLDHDMNKLHEIMSVI
jgi:hypothetical protein